ncbi:MAG: hypothetical protein ABIT83_20140 [Massilia sp.]
MNVRNLRRMVIEAVRVNDAARIDSFVRQLVDCEQAKTALRLKGYGSTCMTATGSVHLVPFAVQQESQQRKR